MNWQASMGSLPEGSSLPEIAAPVPESRAGPEMRTSEGDWLCGWCLYPVANDRERFSFEGRNEFTFENPEGISFEIITFSEAEGCLQAGLPSFEFTWFEGHAWSFAHCRRCGRHLGWFYEGPQQFVGLIKDRLVRAVLIAN